MNKEQIKELKNAWAKLREVLNDMAWLHSEQGCECKNCLAKKIDEILIDN